MSDRHTGRRADHKNERLDRHSANTTDHGPKKGTQHTRHYGRRQLRSLSMLCVCVGGHGGWGKVGEEYDENEESYDEDEAEIQQAESKFVASESSDASKPK